MSRELKKVTQTTLDEIRVEFCTKKCQKLFKVTGDDCRYEKECDILKCFTKFLNSKLNIYEKGK